jgi:hypothetical protein
MWIFNKFTTNTNKLAKQIGKNNMIKKYKIRKERLFKMVKLMYMK